MSFDRWIAWTRQIRAWWVYYNREYAETPMLPPVVRLVDSTSDLGTWDRDVREIRIAFAHVRDDPWHEVMATLRHEMAHQYADEVLLARDELPHGPAFKRACRVMRVEPRARADGPDRVAASADDAAARLTRLVSKLLALGGSPNENEAAAAMRKARQMMLEHNLDVVEHDRDRTFVHRPLGAVKRRHAAWESTLGAILSEFFFVEVIWAADYDPCRDATGTALFAHGTPSNVEMAAYVHGYLEQLLPALWRDHKRARGVGGDRDRAHYYDGVLHGFLQKLRDQERSRENAERALVWRGDPRLSAYYRWHHPRVRTSQGRDRWLTDAYVAGKEAGRSVSIRRPLGESSGGGFGGHLTG